MPFVQLLRMALPYIQTDKLFLTIHDHEFMLSELQIEYRHIVKASLSMVFNMYAMSCDRHPQITNTTKHVITFFIFKRILYFQTKNMRRFSYNDTYCTLDTFICYFSGHF